LFFFFLPAASFFKCCFMLEHLCVDLEQESKEALATCVLVQIYTQSSFLCLYVLAILVCNFACDLYCFIVNLYSVKSSVELMLYCFIMCRIKIKFSYLILSYLILSYIKSADSKSKRFNVSVLLLKYTGFQVVNYSFYRLRRQ
jgi:hypothetical protein